MLGFFGDIVFEITDEKISTFDSLQRDAQSRFEEHSLIAQKPRMEYVGPGLDTITFTVIIRSSKGDSIKPEMDKWMQYARDGNAETLVVAGTALGVDKWVVESVSQKWRVVLPDGVISAGVDVTLREYVSTMWVVK